MKKGQVKKRKSQFFSLVLAVLVLISSIPLNAEAKTIIGRQTVESGVYTASFSQNELKAGDKLSAGDIVSMDVLDGSLTGYYYVAGGYIDFLVDDIEVLNGVKRSSLKIESLKDIKERKSIPDSKISKENVDNFNGWNVKYFSANGSGGGVYMQLEPSYLIPMKHSITYSGIAAGDNDPRNPSYFKYMGDETMIDIYPPVNLAPSEVFTDWEITSGHPVTQIDTRTNNDITLYLKTVPASSAEGCNASIFYHLNGGVNAPKNPSWYLMGFGVTDEHDQLMDLLPATKANCTFDGWYLTEDFSSSPVKNIPSDQRGAVNLYAKFTPNSYSISYDLNGGELKGTKIESYEYNALTGSVLLPAVSKMGYSFKGWYCEEKDTNVYAIEAGWTGNLHLKAIFDGDGVKESDLPLDEAHFPDAELRKALQKYDKNLSGVLSVAEQNAVTYVQCTYSGVKDLTGLEHFKNLEVLSIYGNDLTELNLEPFPKLKAIDCENNNLTSLDLSHNPLLEDVALYGNQIQFLTLGQQDNLTYLGATNNCLTNIDLSTAPNLEGVSLEGNKLTTIDLSKNTSLEYVGVAGNMLTQLDVTNLTKLTSLSCDANKLRKLDFDNCTNLRYLTCASNQLKELKLDKLTELRELDCRYNQLEELDVTNNVKLETFDCGYNALRSLDLSQNVNLSFDMNITYPQKVKTHSLLADKIDLSVWEAGYIDKVDCTNVMTGFGGADYWGNALLYNDTEVDGASLDQVATWYEDLIDASEYGNRFSMYQYMTTSVDPSCNNLEIVAVDCPLTLVDGKAADCYTDGWKPYYICDEGKMFDPDASLKEITDLDAWKAGAGKIDKLAHNYVLATAYNYPHGISAEGHWYVCSNCGERQPGSMEAHVTSGDGIYSDIACSICYYVVKPAETVVHTHSMSKHDKVDATCTTDGVKEYYTCATCYKVYEDVAGAVEIPDLYEWLHSRCQQKRWR